jgi:integrase
VQRAYIDLKLATALRRNDVLCLRDQDIDDGGIHVTPSKTKDSTGTELLIKWSPALHEAVEQARAVRPRDIHPLLFCTRDGKSYVKDSEASGWESAWQRLVARAERLGVARFRDSDLRAKASKGLKRDHAQMLLGHADPKTTQRYQDRGPIVVEPAR